MQQSVHELLPEMAWQAGVLYRLDRIIGLLESMEASLAINIDIDPIVFDDTTDWESIDVTDHVSM